MPMKSGLNILILSIIIMLSVNVLAAELTDIYVLTLNYNLGKITEEQVFVTKGYIDTGYKESGIYKLRVVSFEGTVLHEQEFNFPLKPIGAEPKDEWFDEKGNQIYFPTAEESSFPVVNQATVVLFIPYFKNAKTIDVYDSDDNPVLSVDVGYYADVCDDGICQPHESYNNCPQDCPIKREPTIWSYGLYYYIAALITMLMLYLVFRLMKKNVQK